MEQEIQSISSNFFQMKTDNIRLEQQFRQDYCQQAKRLDRIQVKRSQLDSIKRYVVPDQKIIPKRKRNKKKYIYPCEENTNYSVSLSYLSHLICQFLQENNKALIIKMLQHMKQKYIIWQLLVKTLELQIINIKNQQICFNTTKYQKNTFKTSNQLQKTNLIIDTRDIMMMIEQKQQKHEQKMQFSMNLDKECKEKNFFQNKITKMMEQEYQVQQCSDHIQREIEVKYQKIVNKKQKIVKTQSIQPTYSTQSNNLIHSSHPPMLVQQNIKKQNTYCSVQKQKESPNLTKKLKMNSYFLNQLKSYLQNQIQQQLFQQFKQIQINKIQESAQESKLYQPNYQIIYDIIFNIVGKNNNTKNKRLNKIKKQIQYINQSQINKTNILNK